MTFWSACFTAGLDLHNVGWQSGLGLCWQDICQMECRIQQGFLRAPLSSEGSRRTLGHCNICIKAGEAYSYLLWSWPAGDQLGSEEADLNNRWSFQIPVFILRRKINDYCLLHSTASLLLSFRICKCQLLENKYHRVPNALLSHLWASVWSEFV